SCRTGRGRPLPTSRRSRGGAGGAWCRWRLLRERWSRVADGCRRRRPRSLALPLPQLDLLGIVDGLEPHVHDLRGAGGHVLADVVRAYRQLAVPPADQHGVLDGRWPAHVDERVERGPRRATRVEDVVDEDHAHTVHVEVHLGALDDRLQGDLREVVPVEGDVELAERRAAAPVLLDETCEAFGEWHAARVDADHGEVIGALVALDDLVGDPLQGPVDVGGRHDRRLVVRLVLWGVTWHVGLLPGLSGPA